MISHRLTPASMYHASFYFGGTATYCACDLDGTDDLDPNEGPPTE